MSALAAVPWQVWAVLAGLDEAGHVVVSRADLVAYLNRGTGDMSVEVAALNRLLAAAGIE